MSRYIKHHGIKGQKWGVRRFQKADGTLTNAGKKRYRDGVDDEGASNGNVAGASGKKVSYRQQKINDVSSAYLNPDGTLNAAGKQKFGSEKELRKSAAKVVDTNMIKDASTINDEVKKMANAAKQPLEKKRQKDQATADAIVQLTARERARAMSDKELRDVVNRLNMEENYTRMMSNREHIEVGKSRAEKFVDFTTSALTITSTALSIALAVKQLKS